MSKYNSEWNKFIKEKSDDLLESMYLSENTGRGARVCIRQYFKDDNTYGIVEKIIKKNEKYEVFFKTIIVERGYEDFEGYCRESGSGPGTLEYRKFKKPYTKYLWNAVN